MTESNQPEKVFKTEEMVLNMGPQHPSTHGVLRFELTTDGEVMTKAVPDIGYLHRGIEKLAETVGYVGFMPYTDRIDYVSAMTANQGYAMAVEKLAGIEVTRRAELLRCTASELNRISSHLVGVGSFGLDMGASTPFVHALRERETINDLLESLCGARLTYNYVRIGGVSHDLPTGFIDKAMVFLNHFEPIVGELNRLLSDNKIFIERLANIGVISKEDAINYGLVGPNLRGSGVKFDVRRDEPYSVYPELDFNIPVGLGKAGTLGDCFDRYYVRVEEMRESAKIVRQCLLKLKDLPEGDIMGKVPRKIKPPKGEVLVKVESSRGEMAYWIVSDGSDNPLRLHCRTGSFTSMGIIEKLSRGMMIADLVALIGSFDIVAPEVDR
ncbi:MAG: NADH-quinone oxidoreductase subunit D [Deltaproteobacteria bacterium]|nr:NADH-quinone oxidoreductase subunit D [Deltaproteobacteria bacterium]